MAKLSAPLDAAMRDVQSRYGCRMREGERAKARPSDTQEMVLSAVIWRVAKRAVWRRV